MRGSRCKVVARTERAGEGGTRPRVQWVDGRFLTSTCTTTLKSSRKGSHTHPTDPTPRSRGSVPSEQAGPSGGGGEGEGRGRKGREGGAGAIQSAGGRAVVPRSSWAKELCQPAQA